MTPTHYPSFDDFIELFIAGLKQRPALIGKQIEDSWPGEAGQEVESIWIEEVNSSDEVAGMRAGPIRNNEVYSVFVICDVYAEGGTAKDARDRLTVLVGEVLAFAAEQKRLGVGSNVAFRAAGWRFRQYVMSDGRGAACRIEIKVSGRR